VNIRASAFSRFWGWLGSRTQMFWFRASPSWARGVGRSACTALGSNDEHPEPLVRCSRVASAYATPARVIPEGGQVSEYGTQCPHNRLRFDVSHAPRAGFHVAMGWGTENPSHVLDHDQARSKLADRVGHVLPQTGPCARPEPGAAASG